MNGAARFDLVNSTKVIFKEPEVKFSFSSVFNFFQLIFLGVENRPHDYFSVVKNNLNEIDLKRPFFSVGKAEFMKFKRKASHFCL